ncbi:MAG: pilus assembly protein PilM [Myxococcota bacterium]
MARFITGIDLGSYSVKVVRAKVEVGAAVSVQWCQEHVLPLAADEEGQVKSLGERQLEILANLQATGQLISDATVSCLSGVHGQMRTLYLPFADRKKIEAVLAGELESHLPFATDDMILTWAVQPSRQEAGQPQQPQYPVIVAFAHQQALQEHLNLLAQLKLDPYCTTLCAAALADTATFLLRNSESVQQFVQAAVDRREEQTDKQQQPVVMLVDIGHLSTKVSVCEGNRLLLARSLLRGGYDATHALSQSQGLSLLDAQKAKHQGESLSEQTLAHLLQTSYAPIVREIRQSALSVRNRCGKAVDAILVTGGGSQMAGLDEFLTSRLVFPVHLLAHSANKESQEWLQPQFASVIGQTAYVKGASSRVNPFNFRQGRFAWRGEFTYLRDKAKPLSIWLAVLVALSLMYSSTQAFVQGQEIEQLRSQRDDLCERVLGKQFKSGDGCLKSIQQAIAGERSNMIPQISAADVYIKLAQTISPELPIRIDKLDITDVTSPTKSINIEAISKTFEDVDRTVEALSKNPCFTKVEKGRAAQTADGVRFQLKIELECSSQQVADKAAREETKS